MMAINCKKLCVILTAALACMDGMAQTSPEEMRANPCKAGGVYLAYPVPTEALTPAPKGYKPVYISHYGRHGSRYLIGDRDYGWVVDLFNDARQHNALTEKGKDVCDRLNKLWPEVEHRGGDLSIIGVQQQQGIAERMYRNYPNVFKAGQKVSARSTMSLRCAMSMAAFGDRLKTLAPQLDFLYEASDRYMAYLNYHADSSNVFTHDKTGPWVEEYRKFEEEKIQPDRMMKALFSDRQYVRKKVNPTNLMWGFYWIAVDMQDIPTDLSFFDVFEGDELFNVWQCNNYRFYVCNANHAASKGIVVDNATHLLRNIIESADEALSKGDVAATLRFGHDGNVIPLLAILGIENFNVAVEAPEDVYKAWCDFQAAPMAANVQMVFYKNKSNDVLVKFMHNEREVHIAMDSDIWPYYRWNDVREYLSKRLK